MPAFPEREKIPVQERPEEATPLTIERKEVATPIPVQFKAQVKSDKGQPLIQTSGTQTVSVTIPKSQVELVELAKGSISDSITWFAAFWLRMIKKAIHFGWGLFQK
jgi:YbbR domain-containing protein